jgi:hypothetical protein
MEGDFSTPKQRTLRAGMLGTAGLVVAGCDNPTVGEDAPSRTQPATSARQPSALPQSSMTSTYPAEAAPADAYRDSRCQHDHQARDGPSFGNHQLREWRSSDSQYNRTTLICLPALPHPSQTG